MLYQKGQLLIFGEHVDWHCWFSELDVESTVMKWLAVCSNLASPKELAEALSHRAAAREIGS